MIAAARRPIADWITGYSRNDLPALCRDCGFTSGAEIGVWKGEFSAKFCLANPALHMLCVDPWQFYPGWKDNKNDPDGVDRAYAIACRRLAHLNCTMVRKPSVEAAVSVPDRSLDFVYIDGNHTKEAVLADLEAWAPKVRSGGFVAGHDYRYFPNKPDIHVIEAVQSYTKAHAIAPWYVLTGDRTPSFLWVVQ